MTLLLLLLLLFKYLAILVVVAVTEVAETHLCCIKIFSVSAER
jgi:hypothetical protein